MSALWEFPPGEGEDSKFVKTAAVNVFGSETLIKIVCVKGNKKGGVMRHGLYKVALDAIRG